MRALILIDKPNWAFHSIAKALVKYNDKTDLRLHIMHIKANETTVKKQWKKYDRILVMGWHTFDRVSFLDKSITMVGIHSYHSWDDRKTTPEKDTTPPRKLIDFLSSFKGINAVSRRLTDLFKKHRLLNVVYTPNGVDTDIFRCIKRLPVEKKLIVGYSGSRSHDWRKGVSEFILPAAKKANADIKIAMLSTDNYLPLEEMYKFYNEIDCYICASSSEGMSLSVLEAGACGRPIIGTKVSGNTEIIKNGQTGFLVDRNVDSIVDKINMLQNHEELKRLSIAISDDIKQNWCWSKRAANWIDFLCS